MTGKNSELTDYLSRDPSKEASTEEIYKGEHVINTISKLFLKNHNNGQLPNTDRKISSTEESTKMTSKTNRELTNGNASLETFIPDAKSQDFTGEQALAINSINTISNAIDKNNNFDFTDLKMETKFTYDYHHWGANQKMMKIKNSRD